MEIEHFRRDYSKKELRRDALPSHPMHLFKSWLQEAIHTNELEPNAMVLTTASHSIPSIRTVLIKEVTEEGVIFYTNTESVKAIELKENPHAAGLFLWLLLERQVSFKGTVRIISKEKADSYFKKRPRESQLASWASRQDQIVMNRNTLDSQFQEMEKRFKEKEVPAPPWWGGYLLTPDEWIFWQGRQNRLHDRFRYQKSSTGWEINRLMP